MIRALVLLACSAFASPPYIVKVHLDDPNEPDAHYMSTGSFIKPDMVLTNEHAVRGGGKVGVETQGETLPAIVVKIDKQADLALLYVPGATGDPILLGEDIQDGERVTVCGYARGIQYVEYTGIVDGRYYRGPANIFSSTATAIQGMSGGPAVVRGKLVGVLFGGGEGYSMMVDLPAVRSFLK